MYEDLCWFGAEQKKSEINTKTALPTFNSFPESGYYSFRDQNSFTFIRCGNHRNRPSQADNLHIDIWFENKNLMCDAGTFQYNGDAELNAFYFGSLSHNTIQLGNLDQMLKGRRFIWYYWTNCVHASINETETAWQFSGAIRAFRQTGKWVIHTREVNKIKNAAHWEIIDTISDNMQLPVTQIWNPALYFYDRFEIFSEDAKGIEIIPQYKNGYYSETYGVKKEIKQIQFTTLGNKIKTRIRLKPE
jgi:hypothetical protein